MRSAGQIIQQTRSQVAFLVEREERTSGSRMVAYENVAAQIGKSASWVRAICKGYVEAVPDIVVGLNIMQLYDRVCLRIEGEAEEIRAEARRRRAELYAANPGFDRMVEGETRTEAHSQTDEE